MEATGTIRTVTGEPDQQRDRSWLGQLAGRFIAFEGPDGSGKSTQYARFAQACKARA